MAACSEVIAARARFPAGLMQPDGCYRFGEEALLLAASGARYWPRAKNIVELGTGCGAALLGCLLLLKDAHGLGIDREPELLSCAVKNAALLDLPARFVCGDLADKTFFRVDDQKNYDLALANPPWRLENDGRSSGNALRNGALRSGSMALRNFFAAAAFFLRHKGHFCLILSAGIFISAIDAARNGGFGLRFAIPIKTSARNGRCERLMLACQKGAKHDLQILDPVLVRTLRNGRQGLPWPARVLEMTGAL